MKLTEKQWKVVAAWAVASIVFAAIAIIYFATMGNAGKYFDIEEFDSPAGPDDKGETYIKNGRAYLKDSGKKNMKKSFLRKLDRTREGAGFAFTITSGYRTVSYNKKVGGVNNSAHVSGMAADIHATTREQKDAIVKAAIRAGFTRIGWGPTFIHLDNDPTKPQNVLFGYAGSTPPYSFQTAKQQANA